MIYLDNSATTQVCREALEASAHYMNKEFFNPSAAYRVAVQVERRINDVRTQIAKATGANAEEVFFTSGGTESNNIAILGCAAMAKPGVKLITTEFEHPAVHEVFAALDKSGKRVARVGLDTEGRVRMDQLESELTPETAFVSVMHVNNELGSVADLTQIAALIKRKSPQAFFHSDGVQAFCKLPFANLPVDMYSVSAHKFHAPKGVGALVMKAGVRNAGGQIGGGQENGVRSGTVNAAGIIAMGAAMPKHAAMQSDASYMMGCKMRLFGNLRSIPDMFVNGPPADQGAPHILNVSFIGVSGETLLHTLEEKGVFVSVGSACSARRAGRNRVLEAIGLNEARISSAVRLSLCRYSTIAEMDAAAQAISDSVKALRRYQRK